MDFTSLGLQDELLRAVADLGFETPMPIQEQAIPLLLAGERDFVGLAQTGTGKTCAFGLPLLSRIDSSRREPQALVVCPTRELCLQTSKEMSRFAKHLPGLNCVAVYGGASIGGQISQIRRGAHVVIATPGRLLDLVRRKALNMSAVGCVVLDEADEMLNMGFRDEIDAIFESVHEDARVWLFSATMAEGVARIAKKYLTDPAEVIIGERNRSAENITHVCYMVRESDRYQVLLRLLESTPGIFGLVFCRTRQETREVAEHLLQDGYPAEALHGELSQGQRDNVMRKFRKKAIPILVATDVAARGLDVQGITHVIHYRLPDDGEAYTHRSGRTARAGMTGFSIALITSRETWRVRRVEKNGRLRFEAGRVPTGEDICTARLKTLVETIGAAESDEAGRLRERFADAYTALDALDTQALVDHIVNRELGSFLKDKRAFTDLNASSQPSRDHKSDRKGPRKSTPAMHTLSLSIDIGRSSDANKSGIVRFVCDVGRINSDRIGSIVMHQDVSYFEVDENLAEQVLLGCRGAKFDGREVDVRLPSGGARRRLRRPNQEQRKRPRHHRRPGDGGRPH
ncbi:MAG: DEAD/DEAH box helicase [Lentisphaeria bacterium]|nr:DEAD/DEAH box helicase [Lentisphaeria bacterium]